MKKNVLMFAVLFGSASWLMYFVFVLFDQSSYWYWFFPVTFLAATLLGLGIWKGAVIAFDIYYAVKGVTKNEEAVDEDSRFVPDIAEYPTNDTNNIYFYVVDNKTGVVYLKYYDEARTGITVMLNADGTPITIDQLKARQD